MKFRLFYRGRLKSNGGAKEKHSIRKAFHPQLKSLWLQEPLKHLSTVDGIPIMNKLPGLVKKVNNQKFLPLVCHDFATVAELDIVFLRPGEPGSLIKYGGDIDNRIKTLLDGLRVPLKNSELPSKNEMDREEDILYCLFEDDARLTHLSITTDRLLDYDDI
ncbi:MAG: hypothetical protein RBT20_02785, partial [Syntrophales bacterium]|nr:hypothetical protein [Syntrophales bacterium]